jgi:hypothetical protein
LNLKNRNIIMAEQQFTPHKITKPIQLLAAWLAGLTLVNATFLVGAKTIATSGWIPGLLAIAAVVNVPLFIFSLFILQTKFRPEMQEDTFYSKYLEKKYSSDIAAVTSVDFEAQFKELSGKIVANITEMTENREEKVASILKENQITHLQTNFGRSRTLSELYLHNDKWNKLLEIWEGDEDFEKDLSSLISSGIVTLYNNNDKGTAQLTGIGTEVADRLKTDGVLWNQLKTKKKLDYAASFVETEEN